MLRSLSESLRPTHRRCPSGDSSSTRPSWRRMTRSAMSKWLSSWLMTRSRLARGPQLGEQLVVENLLERGVLIGGPFVEDADGPVLQQGAEQGQPPPLALREVERRERAPRTETTRRQSQSFEPVAGQLVDPVRVEAEEVAEEMAVGEDDREELAIGLAISVAESMPVEPHDAGLGPVEAGEQLDQGRLAAAVAPGQDDELAGPERQVDGAEREAASSCPSR